jgi:hypothetical protein
MPLTKQESKSHPVIVPLPEEQYTFLKGSRGMRTLAMVLQSCASWMVANLDTSLRHAVRSKASAGDRRSCRRYSIQMRVEARTEGHPAILITGTTLNISSTGLLLTTSDPIEPNVHVRVAVDWPLLSYRGKPQRLWSSGEIIWRSGGFTGVRVSNWVFREGRSVVEVPSRTSSRRPI